MRQSISSVTLAVSRFFRWWTSELSACAQDVLARVAPKWRRTLTVYVDHQRLLIVDGDSAVAQVEVSRSALGSASALPLPDTERSALEPGRRVRLVFDTGFAFIKQLRMPLAALPHLKSALTLQLPKWLPMNPALLTTDFAIVALDPEHSAFELELAAIKLADIEPVANALRRWGFRLSSVHLGGRAEAPPRFRFPTYDSHTRRFAITRVDSVLLGTAAVLGVAAMVVSAVQAYRAQSALDQAQMLTVAEAGMVMEQRQRLLARLEPLSVLSSHERSVGAAAILAEVTARVPQDTWLTTFELKGRTLRLVGLSADVANVVKLLTDSPELAGVELRTSISAGLGTGKDRFEITAEVKGGA